jgi:ankyrin repeat protein
MDQMKRPELLMAVREGDSPVRLISDLLSCNNETAITIDKDDSVHPAEAVTSGLDSILHVVASAGDSAGLLASASMIHSKARHLLVATNRRGDTPLHCAARDGRIEMVSHLIQLARAEAGDDGVKAMLRKQNRQRETALHEALRLPGEQMAGRGRWWGG